MNFAFIIMGDFDPRKDRAAFSDGTAQIIGVSDLEEARNIAKELCESGADCIELCGAFGEDGARQVIAATDGKIPIGYITHLPEQDNLYAAAFSQK